MQSSFTMEGNIFIGSVDWDRYFGCAVIQPTIEGRHERKGRKDEGLASIDIIMINNNDNNNYYSYLFIQQISP